MWPTCNWSRLNSDRSSSTEMRTIVTLFPHGGEVTACGWQDALRVWALAVLAGNKLGPVTWRCTNAEEKNKSAMTEVQTLRTRIWWHVSSTDFSYSRGHCRLQMEAKFVWTTSSILNISRWDDQQTLRGKLLIWTWKASSARSCPSLTTQIHRKTTGLVLTQIAVCGTAQAGGGRVGVMGVVPIFLRIPEAGAALAGWGASGNLVGMGLLSLPKHQPQIHFGRQQGSTRQLRIPGTAGTDWYLAADETERHALFSHENVEYSPH